MAHFDHLRELTPVAIEGINACIENGVICVNQCPIIKGVNDDAEMLSQLYSKLSYIGCTPYYLFQGRPTAGNEPFELPIIEGYRIFQKVLQSGSGLARRAKFVMSHETGKVEILSVDQNHFYMRYHQCKNPDDLGRVMVYRRDDQAFWLDQLELVNDFNLRSEAND